MRALRLDQTDDPALVAAARSGDRAALDRLLASQQAGIYAVCLRITGNRDDAQDACQEALIGLARGLERFDGRSRLSTWAYRIAANAALDELRRRRRRPDPSDLTDRDDILGGGQVETGRGALAQGAREDVEDTAERLDVEAALSRLPVDYRAAVVLRDLCGLDYAEIGEILGIPGGTVRSRIARGRAALVPLLGNRRPDEARPTPRS